MIQKDLSEIHTVVTKKRRLEAIWKKVCLIIFACSSISFVILEPLFFKSLIGFAIAVILFIIFSETSELDSSEPDGGHDKAFGQGCLYSALFFMTLAGSVVAFLFAITDANNFLNVALYVVSVSVCGYFYLFANEWLFPNADSAGRSLEGCWVCEIGAYSENAYKCPFCDFVSKDKKRHGLARHISKQHHDQLDGFPSFQAICEDCIKRDT